MIQPLDRPPSAADLRELARLLVDAVDSGASVTFLPPLTVERAERWWDVTLTTSHPRAVFLVARDREGIAGSVQLHPAWAPNQPHRADVAKLIVHRRARRQGLGRALMGALEQYARAGKFSLLTLDTRRGDAAEALYRALGWSCAGTIPRYARDADGTLCDTVLFYKEL